MKLMPMSCLVLLLVTLEISKDVLADSETSDTSEIKSVNQVQLQEIEEFGFLITHIQENAICDEYFTVSFNKLRNELINQWQELFTTIKTNYSAGAFINISHSFGKGRRGEISDITYGKYGDGFDRNSDGICRAVSSGDLHQRLNKFSDNIKVELSDSSHKSEQLHE